MKSNDKIFFLKNNSFYPLVYNNQLTINKIIKNLKSFFLIDYPNINEKTLILYDNKEIQDFDVNINREMFNLLAVDMNEIIKYRNLTILSHIFCKKFQLSNETGMFIPNSELEMKQIDVYLYKNCEYQLTNFTQTEHLKDLIDFLLRFKNNPRSLFLGILLNDNVIQSDIGEICTFGIPVLWKKTKAIDLQNFIKNSQNISSEVKIVIVKEIYEILSIDDPKDIVLSIVKKFSLIFDESARRVYFDINSLFCSNLSHQSQVYPQPETQTGTHSRVWSFGVLIYFILTGEHVFKDQNTYENYIKNKSSLMINGDSRIQTIIKKCLDLDHTNRCKLSDCINQIEEYFKSLKPIAKSATDVRFNKKIDLEENNEKDKPEMSFKQADSRFNLLNSTVDKTVSSKEKSIILSSNKLKLRNLNKDKITKFSVGRIIQSKDRSEKLRYFCSNAWFCLNFKTKIKHIDNLLEIDETSNPLPKRSDLRKNENSIRITYTRSYDYTIFVGFSDGKILRYYLQSPPRPEEYKESHNGEVTSIVWEKDRDILYTGGMDGKIKIFNHKKFIEEWQPEKDTNNSITCLELIKTEDFFLLVSSYEMFYLKDMSLSDSFFIKSDPKHHDKCFIVSLTYISSKKIVVSGDTFGNICFWKIGLDDEDYNLNMTFINKIVRVYEYIVQTIYLERRNILLLNTRVSSNHLDRTVYLNFDEKNNSFTSKENFLDWKDVDRDYICNYILPSEDENQLIYCFAESKNGKGGKIVFYELTDE